MKQTCENCRFWVRAHGLTGECRRYPPTPIYDPDEQEQQQTATIESYWCGEHKPIGDAPMAFDGMAWLDAHNKRPLMHDGNKGKKGQPDSPASYWWYEAEGHTDQQSQLPAIVLVELSCNGYGIFYDKKEAMLAAARAVESSQYLAMEAHRKASQ